MTEPADRQSKYFNCEFRGQTEAEAKAKLEAWKKADAREVSIIAQIFDAFRDGSDAYVIRVKYEKS